MHVLHRDGTALSPAASCLGRFSMYHNIISNALPFVQVLLRDCDIDTLTYTRGFFFHEFDCSSQLRTAARSFHELFYSTCNFKKQQQHRALINKVFRVTQQHRASG